MLTEKQIKMVKFYSGDVSVFPAGDPFFSDPRIYTTLNSLLFEGFENEIARSRDGKKFNVAALQDESRLLDVYISLLSAFAGCFLEKARTVYRVERYADLEMIMGSGRTVSFTSTSAAGFLKQYGDKKGIALMIFRLPEGLCCIDLGRDLDLYKKEEEAEILLPPWLPLTFKKRAPAGEEREILDMDGQPPVCVVEAAAGYPERVKKYQAENMDAARHAQNGFGWEDACRPDRDGPNSKDSPEKRKKAREAGMRLYEKLNRRWFEENADMDMDTMDDIRLFTEWKEWLCHMIKRSLGENRNENSRS